MSRRTNKPEPVTLSAMVERIADCDHIRLVIPTESYTSRSLPSRCPQCSGFVSGSYSSTADSLPCNTCGYTLTRSPIELSASYGDWDELKETTPIDPSVTFALIEYASGSDYSGSIVERSNHKALLEMMADTWNDGTEFIDYHGGHGTFALAVRLDVLTVDILESVEGLEDYPVIDESLMSEMEVEAQGEQWDATYRGEFKTALGSAMFAMWERSTKSDQHPDESPEAYQERCNAVETFLSDDCGDIPNESVDSVFHAMSDLANVYWENESGDSMYIDVDRVIADGFANVRLTGHNDSFDKWKRDALDRLNAEIRDAMGERKYDLHIVAWVDPNQLRLPFPETLAPAV